MYCLKIMKDPKFIGMLHKNDLETYFLDDKFHPKELQKTNKLVFGMKIFKYFS